jgi:iron complex transport system permease protein
MRPLTIGRLFLRCAILAGILFCVMVLALKFGAIHVSLYGLGRDLLRVFLGKSTEISSEYSLIVLNIRLPRILLGAIVGASLSVAGTSFQALLRNPLADPYVLGVSSGAALGAILALLVEPHLALTPEIASVFTPLGGFLGATVAIAAVYFLGRREGRIDSNTLLLGGVITASLLYAVIILLLTVLPSSNVRGMAYWLMGELSNLPSKPLAWVLRAGFLAATAVIYTTASDLNLLLSGEKEAMHLGVDVHRIRLIVYIAASALTGLAVAVSGSIGYVGLLVPHVMRMIFGSDHRILIPASAFGGAIAVVIADTIARTIAAPADLPVGAITAIAGAPLFIYLLRRRLA